MQTVRKEVPRNKSIVLSPLSVHLALGLLSMGANGPTADELWSTLGFGSEDRQQIAESYASLVNPLKNSPTVKIANKLFIQQGIQLAPDFNELARANFDSEVESLSFADPQQAATTINDWVKLKTNNLIKKLIKADSLDDNTRLVLANALYFKAEWQIPFDANDNTKVPFRTADGKSEKQADMMHLDAHLKYAELAELDAKVLELPYRNSNLKLIVLLPNTVDGVFELRSKLKSAGLKTVMEKLREQQTANQAAKVQVSLPKFKVQFDLSLEDVLAKVRWHYIAHFE